MPLSIFDDSFGSLQQEEAGFDWDDSDIGLCQLAFAMEVDEGAHHCSILCSRTCDPVEATPHISFDVYHAATTSPAELFPLTDCGSPRVHAPYIEMHGLQGQGNFSGGVHVDFQAAKCGLPFEPDTGLRHDATRGSTKLPGMRLPRLPRANTFRPPPRSANADSVVSPTNVDASEKSISYRISLF